MCNVLHHTFFCAQMLKYTQSFCNIQHAKFIFMLISVYKYMIIQGTSLLNWILNLIFLIYLNFKYTLILHIKI